MQTTVCNVIFLLGVVAGHAFAEADVASTRELERWKLAKSKADKKLIQAFDRTIANIKRNKMLPAETRNRHVITVQNQKSAFEQQNQLPEFDHLLLPTIAYLDEMHLASTSLRIHFEKALDQAIGQEQQFREIAAAKELWQSKLPSRGELAARTEFHGNRTFTTGATVDFHFHVGQFENNSFSGQIWQDVLSVSGKSGWQFEGKMEGNQFVITTTKMLHGAPRKLDFRGYVIGRRIVMTLTHKDNMPLTGDLVSIWKK